MNHDNNNINYAGRGNNQRNNNWRSRNNHFDRFPPRNSGQSMRAQYNSMRQEPPVDANVSTTLVNSIKQGVLAANNADRISPVDRPVNDQNCSPVHMRGSRVHPENSAALWQVEGTWSPRKLLEMSPYPNSIPTLNGSPYSGGPTSSPSPVGSSRGSSHSNSSQREAISGSSSPMIPNLFSSRSNDGRRSSAEEMLSNPRDRNSQEDLLIEFARVPSSQSTEEPNYNFQPIGRNVDSRMSDDTNSSYSYTNSRSSESRSSETSSVDNIVVDYRVTSPESGASNRKRSSNSSGSTKCNECNECLAGRLCNNFVDVDQCSMVGNYGDRKESSLRENPMIKEHTSIVPFSHNQNQNMPMSNQVAFPPVNQMMSMPNGQLNVPQQTPFSVAGQLGYSAPSGDQPLAASSPLIFMNQRIISEHPILYCSIHNEAQRFYCHTCSKLFCNECGPQHHVGHITVHIVDATETAQKQANQMITECQFGMAIIREDLNAQSVLGQQLDTQASEAITSVRNSTRKIIDQLHARERELLESIEATRQHKQSILQIREDGLKFGHSRLNQTIIKLSKAVEASSLASNPLDLFVAKDVASAQVFHVKSIRQNLPPHENCCINFEPDPNAVEFTVRSIGSLITGNGHVGDRRVLARPVIPCMTPPMALPRARAVPGANFKVSITSSRHSANGTPYSKIGKPILTIGGGFIAEENLCRPWGVACDREGHIVIADRSNNRIQIFRTNGSFIRRFGTHGTGRVQFDRPAGVAVDARRRIVVADKDNHRIQVLTMEGEFLMCFGEKGTTAGLFNYPWDVATNDACEIVVSDTRNHRIQLFSAEGVFLRRFGFETQTQLWKCLDSPRGVAFTNEGDVLVTDFNNHRIIVVDSDFLSARFLGCDSLTPHPMPHKTFLRPQGIAVDDDGHIIVCDSRNHRVQILDGTGFCHWRFGTQGLGPDHMDRPSGVAVTPDGKIVVVDFGNNRVLVF